MGDREYAIVPLEKDLTGKLIPLYEEVHGRGATFDSRNFIAEDGGVLPTGHMALRANGTAAAYYGVFPMRAIIDGRTVAVAQSGSTMSAPQDQGKGLFTRLAAATFERVADQGCEFVFGFPNVNSYPGFVRKLGWTHRRTMTSYVFPSRPPRKLSAIRAARTELRTAQMTSIVLNAETELEHCAPISRQGRIIRDREFMWVKSPNIFLVENDSYALYARIGRKALEIGDLIEREPGGFTAGMDKARALAAVAGRAFVMTHQSPGSALDRKLFGTGSARSGLPYAHLAMSGLDPDQLDATWIDYDTF